MSWESWLISVLSVWYHLSLGDASDFLLRQLIYLPRWGLLQYKCVQIVVFWRLWHGFTFSPFAEIIIEFISFFGLLLTYVAWLFSALLVFFHSCYSWYSFITPRAYFTSIPRLTVILFSGSESCIDCLSHANIFGASVLHAYSYLSCGHLFFQSISLGGTQWLLVSHASDSLSFYVLLLMALVPPDPTTDHSLVYLVIQHNLAVGYD